MSTTYTIGEKTVNLAQNSANGRWVVVDTVPPYRTLIAGTRVECLLYIDNMKAVYDKKRNSTNKFNERW